MALTARLFQPPRKEEPDAPDPIRRAVPAYVPPLPPAKEDGRVRHLSPTIRPPRPSLAPPEGDGSGQPVMPRRTE